MKKAPKHQHNFRMQKLLCNKPFALTSPPMANPPARTKLHQLMGWIYLSRQPLVITLSRIVNLMIMLTYSHMLLIQVLQHPSYQVFLLIAHVSFRRTPSLSLGLCPPRQSSHSLVRLILNLNDISSQDRHLSEPTNSYHAPAHDNNPNAIASSFAIVTCYGK